MYMMVAYVGMFVAIVSGLSEGAGAWGAREWDQDPPVSFFKFVR